ncbi:hypothetical protein D9K79_05465 [Acinetobacter cumulans]|uniref:Shikimate kinase n=2 Tax=Acinetobacter cumulans TaxID=2136182 RepID=A0ABX9U8W0_9GAMM|nr:MULTISPECIES: shikimate kinase [Acinetobacter]RFS30647.1 hypothetical protein DYI81_09485 [Acinetobacter sp. SWAC5]RKG43475.1 hypothetical protein D7V51_09845 [Acinetobacter cumulans]RLL48643.1 hypothetical protein D9K79_05465 [Acinetobacter cumulans]RZG59369.1 hypothetical protein EXE29_08665 [Acinetobacter sp. WCHAc060006]
MLIQFIGPGGAGKTTIAKQLAPKIGAVCIDLDEYFLKMEGDISLYIQQHGYLAYARRNITLYQQLRRSIQPEQSVILVCSSGFMTYALDQDAEYKTIKHQLLAEAQTYVFLPSLDKKQCIDLIVQRQLNRAYLQADPEKECLKISQRFDQYASFACTRVITHDTPENIVNFLMTLLAAPKGLNKGVL